MNDISPAGCVELREAPELRATWTSRSKTLAATVDAANTVDTFELALGVLTSTPAALVALVAPLCRRRSGRGRQRRGMVAARCAGTPATCRNGGHPCTHVRDARRGRCPTGKPGARERIRIRHSTNRNADSLAGGTSGKSRGLPHADACAACLEWSASALWAHQCARAHYRMSLSRSGAFAATAGRD